MALTKAHFRMVEGAVSNVLDFGAIGDNSNDDTSAIQAAINAAELVNGAVYFPAGTYKITATLVIDNTIRLFGDTSVGSIISNVTNDVVAISIHNPSRNADRCVIEHLRINHEASTKYAVEWNAPFGLAIDLRVECVDTGFGCLLIGDETEPPATDDLGYLFTAIHCRFWRFTDIGVRVNSRGTLYNFTDCHVSSVTDGSKAAYFNKEGATIIGGQWGGAGATSIPVQDFNTESGDREGNTFENLVFEGITNYAVSFDGATNAVVGGQANGIYANLLSNSGTIFNFGKAKQCVAYLPRIKNPTSGGTVCRWGTSSVECTLICDYQAATAPIIVGAGATRAVKIVRGRIARSQVSAITTNAELTVILPDGITDLPPGFIPVHNGAAWNFQLLALGDDTAASFTPPSTKGTIKIYSQGTTTTTGEVRYDTTSSPECGLLYNGGDLEATTGTLAGTTGTNNKITVSAANNGKIYVENRFTASNNNITVLIESEIYGV